MSHLTRADFPKLAAPSVFVALLLLLPGTLKAAATVRSAPLFGGMGAATPQFVATIGLLLPQPTSNDGIAQSLSVGASPTLDSTSAFDRRAMAPLQKTILETHPQLVKAVSASIKRNKPAAGAGPVEIAAAERRLQAELEPYRAQVRAAVEISATVVEKEIDRRVRELSEQLDDINLTPAKAQALIRESERLGRLSFYGGKVAESTAALKRRASETVAKRFDADMQAQLRAGGFSGRGDGSDVVGGAASPGRGAVGLRKAARPRDDRSTSVGSDQVAPGAPPAPPSVKPIGEASRTEGASGLGDAIGSLVQRVGRAAAKLSRRVTGAEPSREGTLSEAEIAEYIPKILAAIPWYSDDATARPVVVTQDGMSKAIAHALRKGGKDLAEALANHRLSAIAMWANPIHAMEVLGEGTRAAGANAPHFLNLIGIGGTGSTSLEILGDVNGGNIKEALDALAAAGGNAEYLSNVVYKAGLSYMSNASFGPYVKQLGIELGAMSRDDAKTIGSALDSVREILTADNIGRVTRELVAAQKTAGRHKVYLDDVLNGLEGKIDETNVGAVALEIGRILRKFKPDVPDPVTGRAERVGPQGLINLIDAANAYEKFEVEGPRLTKQNVEKFLVELNAGIGAIRDVSDEHALVAVAALQGISGGFHNRPNGVFNGGNFRRVYTSVKKSSRRAGKNAQYLPRILMEFYGDPRMTPANIDAMAEIFIEAIVRAGDQANHVYAIIDRTKDRWSTPEEARTLIWPWADALAATGKRADYISDLLNHVPLMTPKNSGAYAKGVAEGLNTAGGRAGEYKQSFEAMSAAFTDENAGRICLQIGEALVKSGKHYMQVGNFLHVYSGLEVGAGKGRMLEALLRRPAWDKGLLALFADSSVSSAWEDAESKKILREIIRLWESDRSFNVVKQLFVDYASLAAGLKDILKPADMKSFYQSVLDATKAYGAQQLTAAELSAKIQAIRIRVLKQVFHKLLEGREIDESKLDAVIVKVVADEPLMLRVINVVSLNSRIAAQYSDTSEKIKAAIWVFYENGGDPDKLNSWLVGESAWNKDVYAGLIGAGYDARLFTKGYKKTLKVSGQDTNPTQRMSDQTWQLYEVAQRAGVEGLPEREEGVGFSSIEDAKAFAERYLLGNRRIVNQDQIGLILSESQTLANMLKAANPDDEALVTVELHKDFMKDSCAGVGVAGCFNPLTGSHKEMPAQHSLKANETFLTVRDAAGSVVANAVVVMTPQGAIVQKLYVNVSWTIDLHDAVFDVLADLVVRGWVPKFLGNSGSAGLLAHRENLVKRDVAATAPKILTDEYYSDLAFEESDGRIRFNPTHVLEKGRLVQTGYRMRPGEQEVAVIATAKPPVVAAVPAEPVNKRGDAAVVKTKVREALFRLGYKNINMGPLLGQLDRLLDASVGEADIRAAVLALNNRDGSAPDADQVTAIVRTILAERASQ